MTQSRQELPKQDELKQQDEALVTATLQQLFRNKKFLSLWAKRVRFHKGPTGSVTLDQHIIPQAASLGTIENILVTLDKHNKSKFTKICRELEKCGISIESLKQLRKEHVMLLSGRHKLYVVLLLLKRRLDNWNPQRRIEVATLNKYLNLLLSDGDRHVYQVEINKILGIKAKSSPARDRMFSRDEKKEKAVVSDEKKTRLASL
ncbi:MAG: hypothetical protein ACYCQI_07770 [Gammaproteobacteria bacterium]